LTSGQGEGFAGQQFHSAAGVGLHVENGRSLENGIFRVDLAYNMDRRRLALVLCSDHVFRAFSDIEFIPPQLRGRSRNKSRGNERELVFYGNHLEDRSRVVEITNKGIAVSNAVAKALRDKVLPAVSM
jgi:hypothetical protein